MIRARLGWGIAGGLVCLLVMVAHVRFAALDGRPPVDLNRSYEDVPGLFAQLGQSGQLGEAVGTALTRVAGWYDLLLAAALRLLGRSVYVVHGFNAFAVGLAMVCGWLIARRLFGGPAGAGAAALLGNASALIVMGRVGWIHVPELALVSVALAALVHDPALRRWSTTGAVAVAGACALAIRPTAMIWVATLLPLLLWTLRGAPSGLGQGLRLGIVGVAWCLGSVPTALDLRTYLTHKVAMRERYADIGDTPGLYDQLTGSLCLPAGGLSVLLGALALVGLVALIVRPRRDHLRFVVLLAVWIVAPQALQLYFVTSPVDFPVLVVAVAILGAGGLVRIHRLAPAALVVLWLPLFVSQWLPPRAENRIEEGDEEWEEGDPRPPGGLFSGEVHPRDHYRPYRYLHFRQVLERVDEACGTDRRRRCTLEVYHGLFHPVGEATGEFGLFLTGRDRVEIIPFWSHKARGRRPLPDAYARYTCEDLEAHWNERFPDLVERETRMLGEGNLRTTWEVDLPPGCRFTWMTPVPR